jgi:5-methylcytosine-specific restriction endonuclease McrA
MFMLCMHTPREKACCHYCFVKLTDKSISKDHVIPRSIGRAQNRKYDTTVWACKECNNCRGNISYERWLLIVRLGVLAKKFKNRSAKKNWFRQVRD